MDISVIIPVYNAEKYLVRCLDSIFNQQFSGVYEVIAVDDGSTDNSLQILQAYQKKEQRLIVIAHNANKKQSIARSSGMKVSRGNYIMHVDSDDWLLPDAFEKLFRKCKETNADVVVFNFIIKERGGKTRLANWIKKELLTDNKLKVQKYFFGATWNKIVKRELVKNMISGKIGVNTTEDLLYAIEILLRAEKICLIPESYYVYFRHDCSITVTIDPEQNLKNQLIILKQLNKIAIRYDVNNELINNILTYLEKWLFLIIAQIQLGNQVNRDKNLEIITQFHNIPIMSDSLVNELELAMTYKDRSMIELKRRFFS
jgi:glycosyltransferase involved in cell wall biosynthesis